MRILVVEDEHRIAGSLKKGLEQEHFVVDLAYDGISGFDLASEGVYDLLILDLMLPGKDGLSVVSDLRKKQIQTPILILTAKGQLQDKVSGLNSGADDYLTKPFSFEELLARVRALSRRPQKSIPDILTVGDLSLNKQSFLVRRGVEINLSSKEFTLLEYLMDHSGKILSKEQIINHVWDYDADVLPNTVEVYIRNLRRKVDLPFTDRPALIKTIRGFGYKIEG
ncbi:MAG: Two component transcriptional regulator, winged helix family [Candidatus Collierbacteria bacterium GW2011_GWB1_44_6]|uniref:Two component transcriptional regulator, winged helix family n=2 Tax=Candidatus Collieribacteriota TaxID=1752725 RepID=A0A0G1MN11_9BACT|nr:MAG: Two component transcriptional regulator, winged helix family [Candidatus Collierbacteria bacterium GW2011_GWC2_43_12]KKT73404.1 MAG: Two component transcriptional regulator, winged helix family [Candidatus Collierbacteria bacterium GW2011_GWB1_44_6]KKT82901.1 MAG: Two component transcriptional regulator, winged helix family [Microgenomates group bacterium GW2011_GWC1_44_9]